MLFIVSFFVLSHALHRPPPLRTLVNGEGASSNGSGPLELQELLEVRGGVGHRGAVWGDAGRRGEGAAQGSVEGRG